MTQELARPGIGHNKAPVRQRHATNQQKPAAYYDDGLLAVAGRIIMLCYAGTFAIATVTFFGSGEALYAVAISIGFALIYFGLPVLMGRVRAAHDQRWQTDEMHETSAIVDVWTGPIHRGEAIIAIVSVPVAVLLGYAAFAIIWSLQL